MSWWWKHILDNQYKMLASLDLVTVKDSPRWRLRPIKRSIGKIHITIWQGRWLGPRERYPGVINTLKSDNIVFKKICVSQCIGLFVFILFLTVGTKKIQIKHYSSFCQEMNHVTLVRLLTVIIAYALRIQLCTSLVQHCE